MKKKELYTSPETEVMELRLEGMIAASVDTDSSLDIDFNNPFPGGDIIW